MPFHVVGVMAQSERRNAMRLVNDLNVEVGRRIAGATIVIAADQRQANPRMRGSPLENGGERTRGVRGFSMEEIAQEHNFIDVV
jgi:hypothetical protein